MTSTNGTMVGSKSPRDGEESDNSSPTRSDTHNFIREPGIEQVAKKKRLVEKLVFIVSVVTVVLLAYGVLSMHWLLPYYYAVSAPLLITIRVIMYWKFKWQYFLMDFCYFGNLLCYIFIWAGPWQAEFSLVIFGIGNGPLVWAVFLFRNSLVFHSVDRMTSVFIHVLPLMLTYGMRWYPGSMSSHWYSHFNDAYSEDVPYMFTWIVGVPLGCFLVHNIIYIVLVYVICRPDENYLNSFRYLIGKKDSWMTKVVTICGERHQLLVYTLFNVLYCGCALMVAVLWYKYYVAHVVYMVGILLVVIFNGASYYMDVFSVRGFKDEETEQDKD